MTRTEQIAENVCKRYGITPEYPLSTVLIEDDPKLVKWDRILKIAIRILSAAAGVALLFWAFATVSTLALQ